MNVGRPKKNLRAKRRSPKPTKTIVRLSSNTDRFGKTPRFVNLAGGSELLFAEISVPAVAHGPEIETCDDARVDQPDPRFSLANERTFLAYVRTALAVLAGGVAIIGYVQNGRIALGAGIGLLAVGFIALIGGYIRWRHIDAAIAAGQPIRVSVLPVVITAALTLTVGVALVAAVTAR
jgi:putative membrane protein